MVFYRKYRPQTIDELDSKEVRETLHAILAKDIAHAFLFTGPKGLGKTSTARIIAKVVNCEKSKKLQTKSQKTNDKRPVPIEPCNECDQCVSITNGTNLDILEIDAASNRGIDEIRDLKDKIRLAPVAAQKKVYIIDEVHMLTTEAFNALLKTLEEPPPHAMFILCTTERQKVPETILSRCFHISFKQASVEELVRSFKRITKGENLTISDDVLTSIANLADGGFRDGAKMLEELVSLAEGKEITKELIENKYKVSSIKYLVLELIGLLEKRDMKKALLLIIGLEEQSVDIKYFMIELLDALHKLLLVKVGVGNQEISNFSIEDMQHLFTILTKAYNDIKYAVLPQLPLELAVIEFSMKKNSFNNSIQHHDQKKSDISLKSLRKHAGNIAKVKALYADTAADAISKPAAASVVSTSVSLLHYSTEGDITKEWLDGFWRSIIAQMKLYNHTLAGILRGCTIKNFDRKTLVIETAYKFHKEKLSDGKTREMLESVCKELLGSPVAVSIILKGSS